LEQRSATSNRIIINIPNGFFINYSILGTIKTVINPNISTLISAFRNEGNATVNAVCDEKSFLRQLNGFALKSNRKSYYNID
jgi:hypothetical protein